MHDASSFFQPSAVDGKIVCYLCGFMFYVVTTPLLNIFYSYVKIFNAGWAAGRASDL